MLDDVSIIIPVGPGDESWRELLADLGPVGAEVILVAPEPSIHQMTPGGRSYSDDFEKSSYGVAADVWWIEAPPGRARQMNAGVARARGRFVWFLHADSRVSEEAIRQFAGSLQRQPRALHYFDLSFQQDGPRLMPVNAAGVWIRSHVLGMPFGDQGLCLPRDLFESLGGFDEQANYGEDHLLVWRARRAGVPVRCCGGVIRTSARKYQRHGWGRTTAWHVWLTVRQAVPQYAGLWGDRIRSWFGRAGPSRSL